MDLSYACNPGQLSMSVVLVDMKKATEQPKLSRKIASIRPVARRPLPGGSADCSFLHVIDTILRNLAGRMQANRIPRIDAYKRVQRMC
ncbi:unnamed protein product [Heligmosomoides polygyrus]|uniref:Uncharacterized protein n=1 Tax=Heligmosomoides polygyrus TaxID=6339 RepID=A0A183GM50_HELPZ|nr:unnamed protein product [Heligmosomoides polygyrus]